MKTADGEAKPVCDLSIDELLRKLVTLAKQHDIFQIASTVLNDSRFLVWSGSSKPYQHHYGKGGLIRHTSEVIDLCLLVNAYYGNPVSDRHLILAALFHDSGKMLDYAPTNAEFTEWSGTPHKRRIHHVSRSAIIWAKAVAGSDIPYEDGDEILHAILSHHGERTCGSPVAPASKLAWILHLCDSLSARIDDCEKFDRYSKSKPILL